MGAQFLSHYLTILDISVLHVGAGQISPRGGLLSISENLVCTSMGFVSWHLIGQVSFTCKLALPFCHFKSGGQGDIEKQKIYTFYYLILGLSFLHCFSVNMAGTSTQQYNLRSGNQETIQFPVQLQMEDGKFLTELLKQQNGQVSDSESSISESDCEALIASDLESDAEQPESSSRKDKVASSSALVPEPKMLSMQKFLHNLINLVNDLTVLKVMLVNKVSLKQSVKRPRGRLIPRSRCHPVTKLKKFQIGMYLGKICRFKHW